MKKIIFLLLAATVLGITSCSLDETNYSTVDTDVAYQSEAGYQALINSCYENIYYLYGKLDGICPMEMGTDLWKIGGRNGRNGDLTNYNSNLTTNVGVLRTVWNALYSIVGYCNTAIYYTDKVKSDSASTAILTKSAEARFLRAFALFHIVEQWGGVVLDTTSFAQTNSASGIARRSSEEEFYRVIINDLKMAVNYLPVSQTDRGRATKKAALGMLAKAYLQRTRLYEQGSAQYIANADSAFQTATMLINNAEKYNCGLYESTATKSGDAEEWDDENNKNNKEFLFVEAVDADGGYNPEGWNRGRTSQYYMMKISTQAQNFGVAPAGIRYGRDNATVWMPTYYLLHDCFEPKLQKSEKEKELIDLAKNPEDVTPDTRFEQAFTYKYYNQSANVYRLSLSTLIRYKKDSTYFAKGSRRRIAAGGMTGVNFAAAYPNANIYAANNSSQLYERTDVPDALGCYTPNWELDSLKVAYNKRLDVGITDYFDLSEEKFGEEAPYTYYRNLFPSLKKFRSFKYAYTNQYDMMDFPILRLTDIYLIAAEAAIDMGTPSAGLPYLNAVRRHAALSGDASLMEVGLSDMTIDYLLKERARELCGEQWRWYDLKRTGRLTKAYLTQKGMNPYCLFTDGKNEVRPVPQQFLDQISNAQEFGNNGY